MLSGEKIPELKLEPKKEEKISLSLSRDTLHVNGIKTATAKAEKNIFNYKKVCSIKK